MSRSRATDRFGCNPIFATIGSRHRTLRGCASVITCFALLTLVPARTLGAEIASIQSDRVNLIQLTGSIVPGDDEKFRKVVAQSIVFAIVSLDSPGGNVGPALNIGREIRARGLSTLVKAGTVCASACALIWLAGQDRYMARGAKIGFHAAYTIQGNERLERGMPNALVGAFLSELKLPTEAIAYVTTKGPTEVSWLDAITGMHVGINYKVAGEQGD